MGVPAEYQICSGFFTAISILHSPLVYFQLVYSRLRIYLSYHETLKLLKIELEVWKLVCANGISSCQ